MHRPRSGGRSVGCAARSTLPTTSTLHCRTTCSQALATPPRAQRRRYLLDTHVLLWLLAGSARTRDDLYATLSNPHNTVYASAASARKIAINAGLGKLD